MKYDSEYWARKLLLFTLDHMNRDVSFAQVFSDTWSNEELIKFEEFCDAHVYIDTPVPFFSCPVSQAGIYTGCVKTMCGDHERRPEVAEPIPSTEILSAEALVATNLNAFFELKGLVVDWAEARNSGGEKVHVEPHALIAMLRGVTGGLVTQHTHASVLPYNITEREVDDWVDLAAQWVSESVSECPYNHALWSATQCETCDMRGFCAVLLDIIGQVRTGEAFTGGPKTLERTMSGFRMDPPVTPNPVKEHCVFVAGKLNVWYCKDCKESRTVCDDVNKEFHRLTRSKWEGLD